METFRWEKRGGSSTMCSILPSPCQSSLAAHRRLLGHILIPQPISLADVSGADRATGALLRVRTVADGCLPHVSFPALPPYFPVAACRDHPWCQRPVERRVPFRRDRRFYGRQVVETRQYFLIRAVWATIGASRPIHHLGPPFMAFFAAPPQIGRASCRERV